MLSHMRVHGMWFKELKSFFFIILNFKKIFKKFLLKLGTIFVAFSIPKSTFYAVGGSKEIVWRQSNQLIDKRCIF